MDTDKRQVRKCYAFDVTIVKSLSDQDSVISVNQCKSVSGFF